jgi:hypothetical protein
VPALRGCDCPRSECLEPSYYESSRTLASTPVRSCAEPPPEFLCWPVARQPLSTQGRCTRGQVASVIWTSSAAVHRPAQRSPRRNVYPHQPRRGSSSFARTS